MINITYYKCGFYVVQYKKCKLHKEKTNESDKIGLIKKCDVF